MDRIVQLLENSAVRTTNPTTNPTEILSYNVGLAEEITKITIPNSKIEIATEWLRTHQKDRDRSGKELESDVMPHGIRINRTYWNDAKRIIRSEDVV